jgi:hypothetical protein
MKNKNGLVPVTLSGKLARSAKDAKAGKAPVHDALKGGLHIWIEYKDAQYFLKIGRRGCVPSAVEWRTVLNAWMWPVTRSPDESTQAPDWFYLSASIPDRRVAEQQALEIPADYLQG